jgi:plastocyanin
MGQETNSRNGDSVMRKFATASVLTLGLGMWGCGGSGYSSSSTSTTNSNPAAPTPMTSNGVVTINVVAINGAQSFSPNPATLPAGQMVVWHNVDNTTHRVVLNDHSVDTGNLAPGASSPPMEIGAAGGQYHCSIHPEMIGSLNQDTPASLPPSSSSY